MSRRAMAGRRGIMLLTLGLLCPGGLPSAEEVGAPPLADSARPRLALVLSGGGARGAAHIGVLKVLEELHVPVDMVVGTSMGSIVGGLYAAGYSPEEIETILKEINWNEVFIDTPDREDKTFRRKQDDATFLIPTRLRFKDWKPYIPPSLLGGQRLDLMLRALEIEATAVQRFDDLPIPFRAVAADLATGDAFIIDHGSLATAMRASMSIAGMFKPVEIDGRLLVDGGAAANLPVGIARDLGADRIIAVDITSPLSTRDELGGLFAIINQMTTFVTYGNRIEDLKRLRAGDVLLQPQLGELSFKDFDRAAEAVGIGEATAREQLEDLRAFAVDDATWAEFQARHHRRPKSDLIVDRVRLENSSWVADQVVRKRIDIEPGLPFDANRLRDTIVRLYALDYFGVIEHRFDRQDDTGTMTITTPRKPYGRNSLQFGMSFRDDFKGENSWSLSVRHLMLAANRRAGEWENVLQLGDTAILRSEFYQPFDYGMRFFAAPWVGLRREYLTLWADGEAVSEFQIDRNEAHLDFGVVLGEWGETRIGPFFSNESGDERIGSSTLTTYEERNAGARFQFRVDTRDATVFPQHGVLIDARYLEGFESWGSDAERRQAALMAGIAMTVGRVTLVPSIEAVDNREGPPTAESAFKLGGFLRLSGLGQGELIGARGGLGRLISYIELSRIDLGVLSSRVYGGLSLEAGNVFDADTPISWDGLRYGGSIFFGAQTVLGPIYLGYGIADGGRDRVYLNIGQRF